MKQSALFMNLSVLTDFNRLERHLSKTRKRLSGLFRGGCDSKPIFVLGSQRSGTTMLMYAFHRHPYTLVLDEHRGNEVYKDHRFRSFEIVQKVIDEATFPSVCFKPICDSHLFEDLHNAFPNAHFIWAYRSFGDVANSSLRKFDAPTRAVRLVCTDRPGGGWFQEGVSPEIAKVLRGVYRPDLSDFDLVCLSWWARNQIVIGSSLINAPNVTLVQYETLVSHPDAVLRWLFHRMGIEYRTRVASRITPQSIGRYAEPNMDVRVREICSKGLASLDNAFHAICPPEIKPFRRVER